MGPRYVTELTEGARVDARYALRGKELRAARNGDAYLSVRLGDRSGEIQAVYFRPSPEAQSVPVGAIVSVRGTVTTFKGTKRVSIDSLRPAESWDPAEFLPSGPRALNELADEFRALCSSVTEAGLRRLLRSVFAEKGFFEAFRRCPASQSYHHAYVGGLIEHTIAVARICDDAAHRYQGVDRDLLLTAALLHDVGKVEELEYDTAIGYTDCGRLVGHVILGLQRIGRHAGRVRVGADTLMHLEHALLSHHGELEWGSPKRPSTIEALILHHADNMDAKAQGFAAALSGAFRAEEQWTDASNLFRRPLYAPRPAEDDRPHPVGEDVHQRLSA